MTDKYYDIYFDRDVLQVDQHGHLENPGALHIIEFEYDDDTDEVTACRRVDQQGNVIEDPWKDREYAESLVHLAEDDFSTIDKALGAFEGWLDNNLDWRESYRGDYYNPPEYYCAGIEGYVDEPPYRPHHISDTVIRAILRQRR